MVGGRLAGREGGWTEGRGGLAGPTAFVFAGRGRVIVIAGVGEVSVCGV